MTQMLIRLLLAALLTFAAFALSSSARGQQANSDATPTHAQMSSPAQQPGYTPAPNENQEFSGSKMPSEAGEQTQEALAFTGQITNVRATLVLLDPITRITYRLANPMRAKPFLGRQVKVVGKLERKSNTIRIDTIAPTR
jgi:hypothetical protein